MGNTLVRGGASTTEAVIPLVEPRKQDSAVGCFLEPDAMLLLHAESASGRPRVRRALLRLCHIIATGDTIAMKLDSRRVRPIPALSGEDLVATIPGLAKPATLRVETLFNIPSGCIGRR